MARFNRDTVIAVLAGGGYLSRAQHGALVEHVLGKKLPPKKDGIDWDFGGFADQARVALQNQFPQLSNLQTPNLGNQSRRSFNRAAQEKSLFTAWVRRMALHSGLPVKVEVKNPAEMKADAKAAKDVTARSKAGREGQRPGG